MQHDSLMTPFFFIFISQLNKYLFPICLFLSLIIIGNHGGDVEMIGLAEKKKRNAEMPNVFHNFQKMVCCSVSSRQKVTCNEPLCAHS